MSLLAIFLNQIRIKPLKPTLGVIFQKIYRFKSLQYKKPYYRYIFWNIIPAMLSNRAISFMTCLLDVYSSTDEEEEDFSEQEESSGK